MHTKISISFLLGTSVLFGVGALVMAVISLRAHLYETFPLELMLLFAALIGSNATFALISLEKRVSELERRDANSNRDSGMK